MCFALLNMGLKCMAVKMTYFEKNSKILQLFLQFENIWVVLK